MTRIMTRISKTGVAVATALTFLLPPTSSYAQAPEPSVPTQPAPPKLDPKACADRDRLKRGDTVGSAPVQDNLSDTLARTDGVLCPPLGLDPHIRAPAPRTGSDMPVIDPRLREDGAPQSPK
jgi:hypothetical protein